MKQGFYRLLLFIFISLLAYKNCFAQKTDTLAAVKLLSKKIVDITSTATPVQVLDKKILQQLNSTSVADASKFFAGTVVKDYGGIGGLKTISVRNLGANHTGILYDGIMLGNAQGGQIDLGKFTLENVAEILLYNSAPVHILQTARAYSHAIVLSIKTMATMQDKKGCSTLSAGFNTGSFGYLNPVLAIKKQLTDQIKLQLSTSYTKADGKYNFISYENRSQKVSRINGDLKAGNIEFDAVYQVNDSNKILFKTFYYSSKRGLPGAVIIYNPTSNQRLNDDIFFTQASWQNYFSSKNGLLINVKFSVDKNYYLDPAYQNSAGKLENDFYQQEKYLSVAYSYKVKPTLIVSIASDVFNSTLKRRDSFAINFAMPHRNTFLNNISLQFKKGEAEITANVLQTNIKEKASNAASGKNIQKLTPAISASLQPVKNLPLRLRVFYKNIFRAPTFNDLYYTNIGNINLKPEYAKQYGAGITYLFKSIFFFKEIILTGDGYYNTVKDQILAVPRQNLFQWTMLNIGKVQIKGTDITLQTTLKKIHAVEINARASYSFQQAWNISDTASALYKKQTPYTPVHSGSIFVHITYKKIGITYSSVLSSYRYRLGDQLPENVVQGWAQHDINLQYTGTLKQENTYRLYAAFSNIFNTQYEIIKFYPMPRFNYRLGIIATFKN